MVDRSPVSNITTTTTAIVAVAIRKLAWCSFTRMEWPLSYCYAGNCACFTSSILVSNRLICSDFSYWRACFHTLHKHYYQLISFQIRPTAPPHQSDTINIIKSLLIGFLARFSLFLSPFFVDLSIGFLCPFLYRRRKWECIDIYISHSTYHPIVNYFVESNNKTKAFTQWDIV